MEKRVTSNQNRQIPKSESKLPNTRNKNVSLYGKSIFINKTLNTI